MSSNKQKRQQLKVARNAKKVESQQRELLAGLKKGTFIAVDKAKIVSRSAIPKVPDYHRDTQFTCRDCRKEELWTAKQQQRWYEEQGGEIETTAVRCRACRRKEKLRREDARKVHLDGLARKSKS